MKIISQPDSNKPWSTQVTCYGCGSILEVESGDITNVCRNDLDGDSYLAPCVVCDEMLSVHASKIPPATKGAIDSALAMQV